MNRAVLTLTALLLPPTSASAQTILTIGGAPVRLDNVKVGGRTYIALDQLQKALSAAGGSNQIAATEGCMNEWLFNGTWRLRVTGVRFVPSPRDSRPWGWVITTEIRNGGRQALSLYRTGIEESISVTLKNGDQKVLGLTGTAAAFNDRYMSQLPPGSGLVRDLPFSWDASGPLDAQVHANTPTKLIVPVDVSALRRGGSPLYETVSYGKSPSFRVNLTCRKQTWAAPPVQVIAGAA